MHKLECDKFLYRCNNAYFSASYELMQNLFNVVCVLYPERGFGRQQPVQLILPTSHPNSTQRMKLLVRFVRLNDFVLNIPPACQQVNLMGEEITSTS